MASRNSGDQLAVQLQERQQIADKLLSLVVASTYLSGKGARGVNLCLIGQPGTFKTTTIQRLEGLSCVFMLDSLTGGSLPGIIQHEGFQSGRRRILAIGDLIDLLVRRTSVSAPLISGLAKAMDSKGMQAYVAGQYTKSKTGQVQGTNVVYDPPVKITVVTAITESDMHEYAQLISQSGFSDRQLYVSLDMPQELVDYSIQKWLSSDRAESPTNKRQNTNTKSPILESVRHLLRRKSRKVEVTGPDIERILQWRDYLISRRAVCWHNSSQSAARLTWNLTNLVRAAVLLRDGVRTTQRDVEYVQELEPILIGNNPFVEPEPRKKNRGGRPKGSKDKRKRTRRSKGAQRG